MIYKKSCLILSGLIFILISGGLYGQSVQGLVEEPGGKPLFNANVLLLRSPDSSLHKAAITDEKGVFRLDHVAKGNYLLSISLTGYQTKYLPLGIMNDDLQVIQPVVMAINSRQLNEVTIVATRPFLEQKIDRTIVNIANSVVANGGTALDALEKAPGIAVDRQNGAIALRGKTGVLVQINGRQTYLAMQDVMALLQGMNADQVDRIELITNPSAKYDAEGSSGIINIQLRKKDNLGTNGSISLTAGAGQYGRQQASLQLNHRSNKINLFGSYGFNRGDQGYWNFDLDRDWTENGVRNVVNNISPIRFFITSHQATAGVDFFASKDMVLGMVWTGLWNDQQEDAYSNVSFRHAPDKPVYYQTITDKAIFDKSVNNLLNVNFRRKLGKNEGQLTADLDMGRFSRHFENTLSTITLIPDTSNGLPDALLTEMPVLIDILTFKADYKRSLGKYWKLETGIKTGRVRSDNNMKLYKGRGSDLQIDTDLSSQFQYTENLNALYVSLSGKSKRGAEIQVGLRGEHTRSSGNSVTQSKLVRRDYFDLFPSAFLSKNLNESNQLTFSYSYRIQRPNYQSLNPARSYLDPFAFSTGNPFLNPSYTHSLELKHGLKNRIFTSLGAAFTNDYVFYLVQPVNSTQTERKPDNIGSLQHYNITFSFPLNLLKQWKAQFSATGAYGLLDYTFVDRQLRAKQVYGKINIANSFFWGRGWSAELNGWITTPGVSAGMFHSPWLGSLNMGVQKSWNGKWKCRLSVTDILHTDRWVGEFEGSGFYFKYNIVRDTRILLLNVTHTFGNQKLKAGRQHKAASEEEMQRTSAN
jgi:hypothetical protein